MRQKMIGGVISPGRYLKLCSEIVDVYYSNGQLVESRVLWSQLYSDNARIIAYPYENSAGYPTRLLTRHGVQRAKARLMGDLNEMLSRRDVSLA